MGHGPGAEHLARAVDCPRREGSGITLRGQRIAVQEYGKPNDELLRALEARGASVTSVPVYRWALPDDIEPLRGAVTAIVRGELDVALFTTSVQIVHLMQVADSMGQSNAIRDALRRMVVASIGPPAPKSCEIRESQRISRPRTRRWDFSCAKPLSAVQTCYA